MLAPLFIVFVDLTRLISVGSQTLTSMLTGGLAVALTAATLTHHQGKTSRAGLPLALALWLGWAVLSVLFLGITYGGTQNLLAFVAFVTCLTLTGRSFRPEHVANFRRWMDAACCTFIVANAVQVFVVQSMSFYGTRTAAITSIIALAWVASAASFRGKPVGYLAVLLLLLELARSGSRTALAVSVVVLATSSIARNGRTSRAVVAFALGALAFLYLATTWAPLRDRFLAGDKGLTIGGFTLNTEGRANVWRGLLEAWETHPWTGSGLGTAQEVTSSRSTGLIDQPHNDFLRLLVDQGAIGAGLFVLGLIILAYRSLRSASRDVENRSVHTAALAALVGVTGCMLTDNPLIYIFAIVPTAVLLGASEGLTRALPPNADTSKVRVNPIAVVAVCLGGAALIATIALLG